MTAGLIAQLFDTAGGPNVPVAEYCPDLLSNFSNSSGTISYETIITPRKNEQRELQFAAEGTVPKEQAHFLRELQLLPPPVIPEIVEWDLVKRINKLLLSKEQEKKTVEVQRSEKGTVQQNKRIIAEALNKFLAKPTGMAMNIATVANSKPSKLAIKVCPTEWIRTPSSPLVTLKTLEAAFNSDPYYITETELKRRKQSLSTRQARRQPSLAKATQSRTGLQQRIHTAIGPDSPEDGGSDEDS
ncbi:unnamed protein product [Nippostrongylus brasiliensis]|uniref:Cilia- and flagella-associated protein 206 n=1 Tax=Nippostrongylus brasiliensis TaxID=27835 RepID=A0A0N4Y7T1_NIPBR|nr:unnamed protein product [Nippostrongylus brasiliensis]